jgi:hypothetical protein
VGECVDVPVPVIEQFDLGSATVVCGS